MTREFLALVDCGTSRFKGAMVDAARRSTAASLELPAPPARRGACGECEVEPAAIVAAVRQLLAGLCQRAGAMPTRMYLCSEMHGFVLVDGECRPLTPYIGWRDARAAVPNGGANVVDTLRSRLGKRYLEITGMDLRPGLPYVNVAWLAARGRLPGPCRLLAMPDWIAAALGAWRERAHLSMAAASGFFDLQQQRVSEELLEAAAIGPAALRFARVLEDEAAPVGEAHLDGRRVPVFAGAGDLQCAVLGAGVSARADACVNAGTGSQVAGVANAGGPERPERRPFFHGQALDVITHIPAGRMFESFAALFADIAGSESASGAFWSLLGSLTPDEVEHAPLQVDPNIFSGSWRYAGGGAISGIGERSLGARPLVASIAKGWTRQYAAALAQLDPRRAWKTLALAGGLPRRLPWFPEVLRRATQRRTIGPQAGEDALNGLAILAGCA